MAKTPQTPADPPAGKPAGGKPPPGKGGQLQRWVRTHQGQAAAIAGAVLVAGYALYKRRQAAKATGPGVPLGAMATIQPYDPATAATGGTYYGGGGSGGSPDTAGGMPAGQDPNTAATLAAIQAQLGSLTAGQQGIGAILATGQPAPGTGGTTGSTPTGSTPSPAPAPSSTSNLFGIESNVAGIFSRYGVPVTFGDTAETGEQRLQRIAQAIASGTRTYDSVTKDVQWLAQQQKLASTGSSG